MTPDEYNVKQIAAGLLTEADITRLTKIAQASLRFPDAEVDGKFGPRTAAAVAAFFSDLERPMAPLKIDADGWLVGEGVTLIPSHRSWFGEGLIGGGPSGTVCHVSDTKPGTALSMAKRRALPWKKPARLSSWHASVETDGGLIQMVPFTRRAWHAGSPTAKPIPGLGFANSYTNGIELIGFTKGPFPELQVIGYARLLRALRIRYGFERAFAMVTHASIDPVRRSDPGKEWETKHARRVLELAFA
jgi:hypothetical protein